MDARTPIYQLSTAGEPSRALLIHGEPVHGLASYHPGATVPGIGHETKGRQRTPGEPRVLRVMPTTNGGTLWQKVSAEELLERETA